MIAANKYDIYSKYIDSNPYLNDWTMDKFSAYSNDKVINTKQFLQPYIDNGEKDIYLVNDSHWSYKASKIVGEHIYNVKKIPIKL